MNIEHKENIFYIRFLAFLYGVISISVMVYTAAVYIMKGRNGVAELFLKSPHTTTDLMILYVGIFWILLGAILYLGAKKIFNLNNIIFYAPLFLCAFAYLNFLRENINYDDVWAYTEAAFNLERHEPFNAHYLYPPLWASCLQLLAPWGYVTMKVFCLLVNYISFLLFYILLYLTLQRYGFRANFAALMTFMALIANAAVVRTLFFGQINFQVIDLVLLSLLCYRRHIFLSALTLGIAVHLKATPMIMILPFILNRDGKWLLYFLGTILLIVILTSWTNDIGYYYNFLSNAAAKASKAGFALRDNSIKSFANATLFYFNLNQNSARYLIPLGMLILLTSSLWILFQVVRNRLFYQGDVKETVVYNSYIILLFLMTMISPLVWAHHFVFMIPAVLIMIKLLSSRKDLVIYLTAYILIYLVPAFDFYPYSYNRLAGVILGYVLLIGFLKTPHPEGGRYFETANRWDRVLTSMKGAKED